MEKTKKPFQKKMNKGNKGGPFKPEKQRYFTKKIKGDEGEEVLETGTDEAATDIDSTAISAFISQIGLGKKGKKEKEAQEKAVQESGEKHKAVVSGEDLNSKPAKKQKKKGKKGPDAPKDNKNGTEKNGALRKNKKIVFSDKGSPMPAKNVKLIAKQTGGKWYDLEEGEETKKVNPNFNSLSSQEVQQIQNSANKLLEEDVMAYKAINARGSNKSDFQWMEKMMKTGTWPDRMAAFTVRIQDSPVHNLHHLQSLISLVKVQTKQHCMMTSDTLRDMFMEDLLPPERKLMPFSSRGDALRNAAKKDLIKWAFEDRLKTLYSSYIDAVKRMAADTVDTLRGKGIATIHHLLVHHPEQEEVLLPILVNKLGDPAKKMASRALYYLKELLNQHPRMKRVVVDEVERLLFRNNISKKAQYYGVCFLNLVDLKEEHASLAHKLITVYISFFKACVKTGDINNKMMSGLLTGINRAFPQAKEFGFQFNEDLNTLYKIVQLSQFTIAVQALCILFQIIDPATNLDGADRFYRVLYEKLNAPEFKLTSHNSQFLNLVFIALKADTIESRVCGFAKRLLQICQNTAPNLACAILVLLSEVRKVHPYIFRLGSKTEKELLEESTTVEDSDNSTSDSEDEGTVGKKKVAIEGLLKTSNITIDVDESPSPSHKEKGERKEPFQEQNDSSDVQVLQNGNEAKTASEDVKPDLKRVLTDYDPLARNPRYCGADVSLCHELTSLSHHFHPSVALFAQTILQQKPVKYDGNPLKDFTLTRFLERFSYRNAKPNSSSSTNQLRKEYQPKGLRNLPVNSQDYLSKSLDQIPIEERFFYKFFSSTKKPKVKKEEDDSDTESIGDEEFDSIMDNYFKSVTGGGDESDDDELDLEAEDGDVDFASGMDSTKGKGNKKKKHKESDDESSGEELDDDAEDFEDDGDDFIDMDAGDDEDDFDMGSDEDDGDMFEDDDETMPAALKRKKQKKGEDMFAPAEEFAEMLEENADDVFAGSQTLINRDRADKKQLKWETNKSRWAQGFKGKRKAGPGKPGGGHPNKKKFKKH